MPIIGLLLAALFFQEAWHYILAAFAIYIVMLKFI